MEEGSQRTNQATIVTNVHRLVSTVCHDDVIITELSLFQPFYIGTTLRVWPE